MRDAQPAVPEVVVEVERAHLREPQRLRRRHEEGVAPRPGDRVDDPVLLAFTAALFAKEQSVVLPGLFVLADVLGLTEDPPGRDPRRWLVRYLPLVAVIVGYLATRRALFAGGEWRLALLDDPFGPLLSFTYAV